MTKIKEDNMKVLEFLEEFHKEVTIVTKSCVIDNSKSHLEQLSSLIHIAICAHRLDVHNVQEINSYEKDFMDTENMDEEFDARSWLTVIYQHLVAIIEDYPSNEPGLDNLHKRYTSLDVFMFSVRHKINK